MNKYEFAKRLIASDANAAKYFKPQYSPTFRTLIRWEDAIDCKVLFSSWERFMASPK